MPTLRKRRPDESDTEYSEYLEARRLANNANSKAFRAANPDKVKEYNAKQRESYKAYYETNKEVILARGKEYRASNRDKIKTKNARYNAANPDKMKANHVKQKYGLTLEEYEALLSRGCQVCGSFERLHCDHDHKTGKVRGCLCQKCNHSLGHYENRILPNLDKFTQYLRGTL